MVKSVFWHCTYQQESLRQFVFLSNWSACELFAPYYLHTGVSLDMTRSREALHLAVMLKQVQVLVSRHGGLL